MTGRDIASGAALGLVGLGVMGGALARQLVERGYRLAVFDRDANAAAALASESGGTLAVAASLAALAQGLRRPRIVLLMVPAGEAVDQALAGLAPALEPGDIILDGGNSHFADTELRVAAMAARGIDFLGVGISGGEEGARSGAAIMAGGAREGFERVRPMLEALAARVEGAPCCTWFGPGGAGHFVKTVHNGIEYAEMQLIAEVYYLLRHLVGLDLPRIAAVFAKWAEGPLAGYLVDITADVLRKADPETGRPLLDRVLDAAAQKGTGGWAVAAALELGVPAPIMAAAVHARSLSALHAERVAAARAMPPPPPAATGDARAAIDALELTLHGATIAAFAEGFALLAAARCRFGWPIELARVAEVWRGGCILRARLLETVRDAFLRADTLANLALDPALAAVLERAAPAWRGTAAAALEHGLPVPALLAARAYLDGYRSQRLWADLIQAQRDCFGRHGYERIDRPGTFHSDWRAP